MAASGENLSDIRRALLDLKKRQKQAAKVKQDRIVPVPREGNLAVSEQQRYLWFLHQVAPDLPVYNVPFAVRLRGELDLDALGAALDGLVARHESLRTRFGSEHGVPYQVIDPPQPGAPLRVCELPGDVDEKAIRDWVDAEAVVPFDLENGPVFRSSLLRIAPDDHALIFVWHHIVIDGWSAGVAINELAPLYDAARTGSAADLPPLAVQPADHAAWQRKWLSGGQMERQVEFWRNALDGVEPVDFPTDRPRAARPTWAGASLEQTLPEDVSTAMRDLAKTERMSLFPVLQAAFLVVLARYTGQSDLAVGAAFSGRTRSEIEPLLGFFVNTLVLRVNTAGNPTFRELAARCNDVLLDGMAHQDLPLGSLVEALNPSRVDGRNPLFQHAFTVLPATMVNGFRFGDVRGEHISVSQATSRFDFSFQVYDPLEGNLDVWLEYSTELYDADRMRRLVEHFAIVLQQVAANPETRLSDLDVVPKAERELMLKTWNPKPTPRAGARLLHQVFAESAQRAPDAVAMRFEGVDLSYRHLDVWSSRLAHVLIDEFDVAPGSVVAVLLERGFELAASQLGILKAGGAWLPLDPQYPVERLAYQLKDANVAGVITTSALATQLPADLPRLTLDTSAFEDRPATPPEVSVDPEDTAYVIYTSGSTGVPKGVMVPHRAVVNFCANFVELFSVTPSDRVLQFSNPAFDVSVSDFHSTFAAGATVVGAPRATLLDPDSLQQLMAEERITFVDIPPAVLRLLDPEPLRDLRVCFIGMEAFPAELVNRWSYPGREFHNGYGPTEATITCVDYLCPPEGLQVAPPIGQAMGNQRAYVLDRRWRLCPVGVPGELFMAGAGLARGYLGRPDLTAEKFVPDPFAPEPGERMYATGDVVRWRSDGNLEFLGRVDRQVKIRGLRIELGEVEHALSACPGVQNCAVTVRKAGTPEASLVGYAAGEDIDPHRTRELLSDRLPLHMVPSAIVVLPQLPLTSSGKLDHDKLPDPDPDAGGKHVAPETETERELAQIWHGLLRVPFEEIGAGDNFFNLGGNSLQATQLISRIRDSFDVSVGVRDLFTRPVLEQLAAHIDEAREELELDDDELAALAAEIEDLSDEEALALLREQED